MLNSLKASSWNIYLLKKINPNRTKKMQKIFKENKIKKINS